MVDLTTKPLNGNSSTADTPRPPKRALYYCQYEINRYIGGVRNVIRPEWCGFDNVVEYKLDNLVQP